MEKVFDDPLLLLKILGDNTNLSYITKEMRIFKSTSSINKYRVSQSINIYKPVCNKSKLCVFKNPTLLKKIFLFLDNEDTNSIEPVYTDCNTDLIIININSINFKNCSKLLNIYTRDLFFSILNTEKNIISSLYSTITFSSKYLMIRYYIQEIMEKPRNITYSDNNDYRICNIIDCINFSYTLSHYCEDHNNYHYWIKEKNKYINSIVCPVCQQNIVYNKGKYTIQQKYCSFKCKIRGIKNKKLKMPLNFMDEPILSIDEINDYYSK